ncbi:212_t:CDS:2, partial [Entrophospora sp. SA101]
VKIKATPPIAMLINELGDIPMASDADCGVAEAFGGLLYAGFDVSVVFGASAFGASVVFGASGAFGVVTCGSVAFGTGDAIFSILNLVDHTKFLP